MTQEEKQLLLKDLCGRLPYGVMVGYSTKDNPNTLDKMGKIIYVDMRFGMIQMQIESGISYGLPPSEFIKPYLRPMSSMTKKEIIQYKCMNDALDENYEVHIDNAYSAFDWLNAHHFDYRGLIPMGLAIEVTKENNPYEKEQKEK